MKIKVSSERKNYKLYVPNILLGSCLKVVKFVAKESGNSKEEIEEYLKYIDMNYLGVAIKELKEYKGLEVVKVNSKDGKVVIIEM